jgi:hypothetical protein
MYEKKCFSIIYIFVINATNVRTTYTVPYSFYKFSDMFRCCNTILRKIIYQAFYSTVTCRRIYKNYTTVYVACEFVGLITNIRIGLNASNKQFQNSFLLIQFLSTCRIHLYQNLKFLLFLLVRKLLIFTAVLFMH